MSLTIVVWVLVVVRTPGGVRVKRGFDFDDSSLGQRVLQDAEDTVSSVNHLTSELPRSPRPDPSDKEASQSEATRSGNR